MSSVNSVRKLQILYFSMKIKEIKNLKNSEKKVARYRHLYILLTAGSIPGWVPISSQLFCRI